MAQGGKMEIETVPVKAHILNLLDKTIKSAILNKFK